MISSEIRLLPSCGEGVRLQPWFRRLHNQLLAELSFTYSPFGKRLYVNPWVSAAVEKNQVLPFPGLHVHLEFNVRLVTYSDV